MTPRGFSRGHPVVWVEASDAWVWEDTGLPTAAFGGEDKPCILCGLMSEPDVDGPGPDPCLGFLPDCEGACCGHGIEPGVIDRTSSGITLLAVAVKTDFGEPIKVTYRGRTDVNQSVNWAPMKAQAKKIWKKML